MFKIANDPQACPIEAWKLYTEDKNYRLFISKTLQKNKKVGSGTLLQKSRKKRWKIDNLMVFLSDALKLSTRYTSNGIRITVAPFSKSMGKPTLKSHWSQITKPHKVLNNITKKEREEMLKKCQTSCH